MNSDLSEPLLQQEASTTETPVAASGSAAGVIEEPRRQQQSSYRKMSSSFFAAVSIATIPMLLFGFNTGVLNAPEAVIFTGHTTFQWSLAVSGFCVGGFFGANVSGSWADKWGRRKGLLAIFWLNLLAGLMHVATPNMTVLIIARIIVGLAGGASTVLTPMYLAEISPKEIRGTIGTMTQLSCVLGILASILWELPFDSESMWRYIFIPIPSIAIVGIMLGPCFLMESPPWLHNQKRRQEAMDILRLFRNSNEISADGDDVVEMISREEPTTDQNVESSTGQQVNNDTFEDEIDEGQQSEQREQSSSFATTPTPNNISFRDFVSNPTNRIPLISSILFPIAQQLSGINAVFYYSTSLFEGVISNPQTGTIIAFVVNVIATVIAVLLMDRFGRRTLLSVSAGGMFACCILMTLALQGTLPGMMAVVGVMLYISFFELGLGCIPFFLATEMIESTFLGRVQSISMSCNWFSNFCVGMLFPYMDKYLGAYSFVPFAVALFGTLVYSLFILPESRGKSPSEVMEVLAERQRRGHQPVPVMEDSPAGSPAVETALV